MNEIEKKLRDLENEEKRLAEKKQQLIIEQKLLQEKHKKLDSLFKNSGYATPKELVEDLMSKFGIRHNSGAAPEAKRTRTRITAELRDAVKKDIASGKTKVAVSKMHAISYVVVGKIAKGDYNHL
jgi:hypothetical protein